MQYMVIERFKPGRIDDVYARFHARGRLLPVGLDYVDSWVTADRSTCFQLMSTDDPALFERWFERWSDLIDFEVLELRDPRPGTQRD